MCCHLRSGLERSRLAVLLQTIPKLACAATFELYVLLGHAFTAAKVYIALSLLSSTKPAQRHGQCRRPTRWRHGRPRPLLLCLLWRLPLRRSVQRLREQHRLCRRRRNRGRGHGIWRCFCRVARQQGEHRCWIGGGVGEPAGRARCSLTRSHSCTWAARRQRCRCG